MWLIIQYNVKIASSLSAFFRILAVLSTYKIIHLTKEDISCTSSLDSSEYLNILLAKTKLISGFNIWIGLIKLVPRIGWSVKIVPKEFNPNWELKIYPLSINSTR